MPAPNDPDVHRPALIAAGVSLVGESATAAELAERFTSFDPVRRPAGAAALLARLASLGLVAVASGEDDRVRYVLTPLGHQLANAAVAGHTEPTTPLEELERMRTDLLATIAHELRTPLTAVRTCVGLLLDPGVQPDPEDRARLLRTVKQSAERMQRLVTDVLDLTRFRAGRIRLQNRRFDAGELAHDVAGVIAPLLRVRGQSLALEVPDAPVWVYGDHRRLEQALLNLLSNAHKFSPVGAEVRLSVEARGAAVDWSVQDSGPGISAADQARLFERFFTVSTDAVRPGTGTGLGLPIALAIARAHGGNIEVRSVLGRGSTFSLHVPASGPEEAGEP